MSARAEPDGSWGNTFMDKKRELADAVIRLADRKQGPDGRRRLPCSAAFDLAAKFDAKVGQIGRICNQNNIKICKCQLGCFK